MRRRRSSSSAAVSFFSFQDIILATAGIVILIMILIVVTSVAAPAAPSVAPERADRALLDKLRVLEDELSVLRDRLAALQRSAAALQRLPTLDLPAELARINRAITERRRELDQAKQRLADATAAEGASRASVSERATAAEAAQARADAAADEVKAAAAAPRRFIVGREDRKPLIVEVDRDVVRLGEIDASGHLRALDAWPAHLAGVELLASAGRRDRTKEYFVFFVRPHGVGQSEALMESMRQLGFAVGQEACPPDFELFGK